MCFSYRFATMWDLQRLLFSWSQMGKISTCMPTAWWANTVKTGSALWSPAPRTWWLGKWGHTVRREMGTVAHGARGWEINKPFITDLCKAWEGQKTHTHTMPGVGGCDCLWTLKKKQWSDMWLPETILAFIVLASQGCVVRLSDVIFIGPDLRAIFNLSLCHFQ